MAVIAGTRGRILENAGAPGAGTDEVQTLTIGGTPTSGTFTLSFQGAVTAPITWSSTNNTLVANIDAALGALRTIGGAANVTTAVGTMTAGIGTITITFVAALGKLAVPTIAVVANNLAGTSPTVAVAETTPGVTATHRGVAKGTVVTDTTNGKLYINSGTAVAPTWTVVGSQS
jgi:hypothetical protein